MGDSAIADELESHLSITPRFGPRQLTKDTIAAIRRLWLPREFAPSCGHGTIETPSGELIEGRHPAAWPYDLWQRMDEAKAGHYRRPTHEPRRQPHELSRIVVCAGCRRPLRVQSHTGVLFYRDTSSERKLPCPAHGNLSARSNKLVRQFGDLLASVQLPASWREAIAQRCHDTESASDGKHALARTKELQAEQKRLVAAFTKGYLSEADLDAHVERIQSEFRLLSGSASRDVDDYTDAAITAGETLAVMASYWSEALAEERRDIIWALLTLNGLVYDLQRQAIVGLIPREEMLPVLALGLASRWEQRDSGLWLRAEYLPPRRKRDNSHASLPMQYKLDYEQ
jgi:hypothetical protein